MSEISDAELDEVLAYLQVLKILEPSGKDDVKVSDEALQRFRNWLSNPVIKNADCPDKKRGAAIMVFMDHSKKYGSGTEKKVAIDRATTVILVTLSGMGEIKEKAK